MGTASKQYALNSAQSKSDQDEIAALKIQKSQHSITDNDHWYTPLEFKQYSSRSLLQQSTDFTTTPLSMSPNLLTRKALGLSQQPYSSSKKKSRAFGTATPGKQPFQSLTPRLWRKQDRPRDSSSTIKQQHKTDRHPLQRRNSNTNHNPTSTSSSEKRKGTTPSNHESSSRRHSLSSSKKRRISKDGHTSSSKTRRLASTTAVSSKTKHGSDLSLQNHTDDLSAATPATDPTHNLSFALSYANSSSHKKKTTPDPLQGTTPSSSGGSIRPRIKSILRKRSFVPSTTTPGTTTLGMSKVDSSSRRTYHPSGNKKQRRNNDGETQGPFAPTRSPLSPPVDGWCHETMHFATPEVGNGQAPPFLALVEELSWGKQDKTTTYSKKNKPAGVGWMLELPSEARSGTWSVDLFYPQEQESKDATKTDDSSSATSSASQAPSPRLTLRHVEYEESIGYSVQHHHQKDDGTSSVVVADSLTSRFFVSCLRPGSHRAAAILGQLDDYLKQLKQQGRSFEDSFFGIGSLTVVAFDGFDTNSDLLENGAAMSSHYLNQQGAVERSRSSPPKHLMAIPKDESKTSRRSASTNTSTTKNTVGVAIKCDIACDMHAKSEYQLWVAQDVSLPESPIVAMDIVFPATASVHPLRGLMSPPSAAATKNDTPAMEDPSPLRASALSMRAKMTKSTLSPFDPFRRLWESRQNRDEHTTKSPGAGVEPRSADAKYAATASATVNSSTRSASGVDTKIVEAEPMDQTSKEQVPTNDTASLRLASTATAASNTLLSETNSRDKKPSHQPQPSPPAAPPSHFSDGALPGMNQHEDVEEESDGSDSLFNTSSRLLPTTATAGRKKTLSESNMRDTTSELAQPSDPAASFEDSSHFSDDAFSGTIQNEDKEEERGGGERLSNLDTRTWCSDDSSNSLLDAPSSGKRNFVGKHVPSKASDIAMSTRNNITRPQVATKTRTILQKAASRKHQQQQHTPPKHTADAQGNSLRTKSGKRGSYQQPKPGLLLFDTDSDDDDFCSPLKSITPKAKKRRTSNKKSRPSSHKKSRPSKKRPSAERLKEINALAKKAISSRLLPDGISDDDDDDDDDFFAPPFDDPTDKKETPPLLEDSTTSKNIALPRSSSESTAAASSLDTSDLMVVSTRLKKRQAVSCRQKQRRFTSVHSWIALVLFLGGMLLCGHEKTIHPGGITGRTRFDWSHKHRPSQLFLPLLTQTSLLSDNLSVAAEEEEDENGGDKKGCYFCWGGARKF